MKKQVFTLVCYFLSFALLAQTSPKVKWGPQFFSNPDYSFEDFSGKDETGFYIYLSEFDANAAKTQKIIAEKYTNDHVLVYSKMLEIPKTEGEKLYLNKIVFFQGQLLLFAEGFMKTSAGKKSQLFVFTLNKNSGEIEGTAKKLQEHDAVNSFYVGTFSIIFSKDKSKLAIIGEEEVSPIGKKSSTKQFISVFEKDMKLVWEKELLVPTGKNDTREWEPTVANTGDVAIAVVTTGGTKSKQEAIVYYCKNGTLTPLKINLGTNEALSMNVAFKTNDAPFSTRVLYADNKEKDVTGIQHTVWDLGTNTVVSTSELKFTRELKLSLVRTIAVDLSDYKNGMVKNLELTDYFPRKSGGGYVQAEIREFGQTGLYYGKMLVVNVDENQKLSWIKVIDRSETIGANRFSPIVSSYSPETENIRFILNRINPTKNQNPEAILRNSDAILVTLNKKGEQSNEVLFKNDQKEFDGVVLVAEEFGRESDESNSIVMYAQRNLMHLAGKNLTKKFCTINLK
ncbi:MAG TPA: hypothetical protein VFF27_09430 [Bacteroidia bacterium]|jgi:hypothetical protein|nr:hypothetical protein [Bacteroidia bacterium]